MMECCLAVCLKRLISQKGRETLRCWFSTMPIMPWNKVFQVFFSQRMLTIPIYPSVYASIYLKPSSFSFRKDDAHLPHCLERCEIPRLAKQFSFFSKAGLFPEGWIEKGKPDYLRFTLTPFKNPTAVWGETSRQCQWLSWIYLIYQGRLAGNLFWEK